jgi:hypothetical protein
MRWCLGMYGSASTWTFNLVRELAATLIPDRPVVTRFVSDSIEDIDAVTGTLVVKTHAAPAVAELDRRASTIIITIRDPRDAITSLMAHNKAPFDHALHVTNSTANMCARFAGDKRAVLLRYEDRFFDDPATLDRIAATFGVALPAADKARIFAGMRRDAIEKFIAGMDNLPTASSHFDEITNQQDMFDEVTAWHKHHAGRSGEVGRWRRELSQYQIITIERALRRWMLGFGYPPVTELTSPYVVTVGRYEVIR